MRILLIAILATFVLTSLTVDAKPKRKSKKRTKARTEQVQTTPKDTVSTTEIEMVKREEVRYEEISEGSDDVSRHNEMQRVVVEVTPYPYEEKENKAEEDRIFTVVEQQAQFIGDLNKWLYANIKYPPEAAENGIQGRVILKFVVEKDGSISNISILRGVERSLDREAVRVVKSMPKWIPAENKGLVVRSWFAFPITFRLQ